MTTQTTKEFDKLRAQVEKKLAAKVKPKCPVCKREMIAYPKQRKCYCPFCDIARPMEADE